MYPNLDCRNLIFNIAIEDHLTWLVTLLPKLLRNLFDAQHTSAPCCLGLHLREHPDIFEAPFTNVFGAAPNNLVPSCMNLHRGEDRMLSYSLMTRGKYSIPVV